MDSYVLPIIVAATVICVVFFRARQRVRKYANPASRLSKRDERFATEACYEGLRCVGYICAPGCDSPSGAAEAGAVFCKQNGLKAVVVASLVAAGMVTHYVTRHHLSEDVALAMLNTVNATLAAAFKIAESTIHDTRMGVLSREPAARTVLNAVAQAGFRSSVLAQTEELGGVLRQLIA